MLDHFNIENVAADIPTNVETLLQLPDCFIAQINTDQGNDLVSIEKKGPNYTIFNTENKKEKISEENFLKKFTGIIVAVEQNENETQISESSNIGKYITLTTIVLLASFVAYQNTTSWYTVIFLLLSIIGIITSIAIIKQELGLKTTLGDAFCSGGDDKKDCDAVLTSKGAEVFKGYKLSDFSILYFTGLSLLTFFQISNPAISFTISLFAIPVTLYSLYYQYAVVKKWCLLCLSIVAVLWIQALVPIFTNTYLTDFITFDFVVLGLIALSTIVAWSYIKPLFTDNHKLKR